MFITHINYTQFEQNWSNPKRSIYNEMQMSQIGNHSIANSQVGRVNPLSIITAQDRSDSQGTAQLRREASPRALGPGTGIAILGQGDILRPGVAGAPDLPASRVDDVAQVAPLERHPGVLGPRPAQVDGPGGRRWRARLDRAVCDDIVGRVGGRRPAAGGDCSGADGDDLGVGDPGASMLSEDEVYGALDIAVGVDLVASLGEERVLVSVPNMNLSALANRCALPHRMTDPRVIHE